MWKTCARISRFCGRLQPFCGQAEKYFRIAEKTSENPLCRISPGHRTYSRTSSEERERIPDSSPVGTSVKTPAGEAAGDEGEGSGMREIFTAPSHARPRELILPGASPFGSQRCQSAYGRRRRHRIGLLEFMAGPMGPRSTHCPGGGIGRRASLRC